MAFDEKELNRREFTSAAVMALLGGVTVTVMGCSSSSPMTPTDPDPDPGGGGTGRSGTVSENHGHTATITAAQISAGQSVTLDIRGDGDHPHLVAVTMAEVMQIAAGQEVSKVSSVDQSITTGPHSHIVTFN